MNDTIYMDVISVLQAQSKIGWRQFIEGTLALEWRQKQGEYFKVMNNTTTLSTWISKVIVHMWELVFVVWQHQSSCLHKTPMAELLGGSYVLDQALRLEWRLGLDRMPDIVVSSIPPSILTVMKGTVADRKGWFVLVHRAREQLHGYVPIDAFSDQKGSLRK